MVDRFILLILLLWPLIRVWSACTVHTVGFRPLELPPTSILTFKTVPFVISIPNKISDGAWLCWAAQCQHIAKATNPHHVLRGMFNQNAPPLFLHRSGFMTAHFVMWLIVVLCLWEQLFNVSRSGTYHWKQMYLMVWLLRLYTGYTYLGLESAGQCWCHGGVTNVWLCLFMYERPWWTGAASAGGCPLLHQANTLLCEEAKLKKCQLSTTQGEELKLSGSFWRLCISPGICLALKGSL